MQNRALLALVALLWLVGCDVDLFGSDWKRLGGGYSLLLAEQDDACARITPHDFGGSVVKQIGWRQLLILSRSGDSWDVLDTTTGKHANISEERRQNDLAYRDIPVCPARTAWSRLKRYQSLW
jgi:hypothetical protein